DRQSKLRHVQQRRRRPARRAGRLLAIRRPQQRRPNFLNLNIDVTGTANSFSADRLIANTNVGGFDVIPAQPDRTIDAEPRIAFDRSGGATNGRLYVVYLDQPLDASHNTDVYLKYSDTFGSAWSAPVRVNDDTGANSQFIP